MLARAVRTAGTSTTSTGTRSSIATNSVFIVFSRIQAFRAQSNSQRPARAMTKLTEDVGPITSRHPEQFSPSFRAPALNFLLILSSRLNVLDDNRGGDHGDPRASRAHAAVELGASLSAFSRACRTRRTARIVPTSKAASA